MGDSLLYGQYRQDERSQGFDPIEWIVFDIDANNSVVYLISRFSLEVLPFNEQFGWTNWEESTLREWLNTEFWDRAFSDWEKKHIFTCDIMTKNPIYDNKGNSIEEYSMTKDRVWLLSESEAQDKSLLYLNEMSQYAKNRETEYYNMAYGTNF